MLRKPSVIALTLLVAAVALSPMQVQAKGTGDELPSVVVLSASDLPAPEKLLPPAEPPEGGGLDAAPANDNIGSATGIGGLPYATSQTTSEATLQVGEQRPCGLIGATVWFRYTASATGFMRIDTYGSNFDTVVAVYSGTSLSSPNRGCNDDSDGSLQSELTVSIVAGTTYSIQVGGYNGATGGLSITISFESGCSGNNNYNTPCTIPSRPYSNAQSTSGYSTQTGEVQPCGGIGATAWYRYTPNSSGTVTVTTAGSNFDTVLAVYVSAGGVPVPLVGTSGLVCNDDAIGFQSSVSFSATAGVTYLIQAGGYQGTSGGLVLNVL